jgi:predicted lactoylglutathione lyase
LPCTAIAFERRGDGPSLVLVDGALCDRRLVAADRRGDAVRLFLRQMGAPAIAIGLMRLLPVWTKLTRIAHTLPYDMTIVVPYQAGTPLPAERWHDVKISTLVSDQIYVLLIAEPYFKTITKKDIPDTTTTSEAILQLQVDSRRQVDELADKAFAAGALAANEPNDQGFLYGRSFRDLDGHHWDVFCIEPAPPEKQT